MDKFSGGKSSNNDLLARFLDLIYVIPPVVKASVRQPNAIVRMNLPAARGRRVWVRARDARDGDCAAMTESYGESLDGRNGECVEALSCTGVEVCEDETDPANYMRLGSGPGEKCCCCKPDPCEIKRRRLQELLGPFREKRLSLIRVDGECILGQLPSGYVLSGRGSVKEVVPKRA